MLVVYVECREDRRSKKRSRSLSTNGAKAGEVGRNENLLSSVLRKCKKALRASVCVSICIERESRKKKAKQTECKENEKKKPSIGMAMLVVNNSKSKMAQRKE